jgi:hypothetical protein
MEKWVTTAGNNMRKSLAAPIVHATRSNKRPPNRMVNSLETRVFREFTVVLVFLIEAGVSWSVPELLYLRVLKNISKVTNSRLIKHINLKGLPKL